MCYSQPASQPFSLPQTRAPLAHACSFPPSLVCPAPSSLAHLASGLSAGLGAMNLLMMAERSEL